MKISMGEIVTIFLNLILAIAGGIVRELTMKTRTSLKDMITGGFISAFIGITMYLLLHKFLGDNPYFLSGVIAVCGYIGPKLLDVLSEIIINKLKQGKYNK